MAKKKAVWFKFYPSDFDTDENVRLMDDADLGFYLRCLNHAFINGSLPADMGRLARIMRCSTEYAADRWRTVGKCFVAGADAERLVNPRQEKDRIEINEYWTARSRAGRASANARKQRANQQPYNYVATKGQQESNTCTNKRSTGGMNVLLHARAQYSDTDTDVDTYISPLPPSEQKKQPGETAEPEISKRNNSGPLSKVSDIQPALTPRRLHGGAKNGRSVDPGYDPGPGFEAFWRDYPESRTRGADESYRGYVLQAWLSQVSDRDQETRYLGDLKAHRLAAEWEDEAMIPLPERFLSNPRYRTRPKSAQGERLDPLKALREQGAL